MESDTAWLGQCVGLAVSGGGIRSAIFALGVLQAMAKHGFLRFVDYLSTVSGGGYIGAFVCRQYLRKAEFEAYERTVKNRTDAQAEVKGKAATGLPKEAKVVPITVRVESMLENSASSPIYWLRENGRYLAPRGGGDILVAGAASLRDWLSLQVLVGVFILAVLFTGHGFKWVYAKCNPATRPISITLTPVRALWTTPDPRVGGVSNCHPYGEWIIEAGGGAPGSDAATALACKSVSAPKHAAVSDSGSRRSWRMAIRDWWYLVAGYTGLLLLAVVFMFVFFCVLYWLLVYGCYWLFRAGVRVCRCYGLYRFHDLSILNEYEMEERKAKVRRDVTEVTSYLLVLLLSLAAYRLIDVVGLQLYVGRHRLLSEVGATVSVIAGILSRFWMSFFVGTKKDGRVSAAWIGPISTILGLLLLAVYLVTLSAFSYWCISSNCNFSDGSITVNCVQALEIAVVLFWVSWGLGRLDGFLNLTTLHALYTARLARTFLAASNPERWQATGQGVTEPIPGDDIVFPDYLPHLYGGPLHIINTTLNETVSGESQLEQRDRKGLSLAVSPAGLSVGVSHHASIRAGEKLKVDLSSLAPNKVGAFELLPTETVQAEALSLADWVSISGAAVSTGMGSLSSLGLSIVLAFFNIRLGYWWDSGVDPRTRKNRTPTSYWGWYGYQFDRAFLAIFRVQRYLLDEFLGQFHGPGRQYWNLTDGGHFENTGVYELIRRRLPLIVCLDNGADPGCEFANLGNLVRRSRTDFGAEIEFLRFSELDGKTKGNMANTTSIEITRSQEDCLPDHYGAPKTLWKMICDMAAASNKYFGNLEDLEHKDTWSRRHAAIAVVRYVSTSRYGILIWVKPTLTGDEDRDVIEYHTSHKEFPNESTAQQFFNEAQWESYRNLGRHSGEQLMTVLMKNLPKLLAREGAKPAAPRRRTSR